MPEQMTALAGMHAVLHQRSLSLGIEYGNVHGFFSDAKAHPHAEAKAFDGGVRELTGDLRGASVRMEDRVQIDSDHLSRRLTFTMLDDARLYDLVSRFVVIDRSGVREGWINGQAVGHRARSVYHQFPASEAVVPVGHAHWLRARFRVEGELPPGMAHVAYIRDEASTHEGNRWILHHRLIALPHGDNLALRGCNPRFNRPVPAALNHRVPLALRRALYRIREARWPHAPIMAVAHARWRAGQQVTLVTDLCLSHGDRPQ